MADSGDDELAREAAKVHAARDLIGRHEEFFERPLLRLRDQSIVHEADGGTRAVTCPRCQADRDFYVSANGYFFCQCGERFEDAGIETRALAVLVMRKAGGDAIHGGLTLGFGDENQVVISPGPLSETSETGR